jgi:uncharacterized protein YukE
VLVTGLGGAVSAQQLVPGDPDEVDVLARRLDGFARSADTGGRRLHGLGRDGWTGTAAQAFRGQVDEVPDALQTGARAFGQAGQVLHTHADVLRQAQAQARRAMALWDEAETATRVWGQQRAAWDEAQRASAARGAAPPSGGAPAGSDPGAGDRARALDLLDGARHEVRRSGAAVSRELHEAAGPPPTSRGCSDGPSTRWSASARGPARRPGAWRSSPSSSARRTP